MERLSQVFEFAYGRFLDLREKEERAREAELSASVDRVRAEAMAMAATDDIANVVKALWEGLTLQALGFTTLVFRVEDRQANELQMYVATLEGASGVTFPESSLMQRGLMTGVSLYRSTMPLKMVQGDSQERRGVYTGLERDVNEDVRALWGFELPDELIARTQRLVVPFDYGQISVIREEMPFEDADIKRAESFAEGVSLGFTRYFDFRQLEEQNRELEAANEEVRTATQMKSQFLAGNAIKFTDSGRVTVTAKQEDGQLVLLVADTGKGIPQGELLTIFDEYRQVKGSDREHKGTGLGLSITKQFAELLGGSIGVESQVGKGSTFTVRVPIVYQVD